MNIDAKKLIAKGMKYDDMELVEEGYALLEQQEQDKTVMPPIDEITIIDTEVHKRGASKIISNEVVGEPLLHKKDDFNFQIRDEDNSKYTRSVPIDTSRMKLNLFEDDLTEDMKHSKAAVKENNEGKTFYKDTVRKTTRTPPAKMMDVMCTGGCEKSFKVAPIHAKILEGESRYICDNCIIKKGRNTYGM